MKFFALANVSKTWKIYYGARLLHFGLMTFFIFILTPNIGRSSLPSFLPTEVPGYTDLLLLWPFMIYFIIDFIVFQKHPPKEEKPKYPQVLTSPLVWRILFGSLLGLGMYYLCIQPINYLLRPFRISGHFFMYSIQGAALTDIKEEVQLSLDNFQGKPNRIWLADLLIYLNLIINFYTTFLTGIYFHHLVESLIGLAIGLLIVHYVFVHKRGDSEFSCSKMNSPKSS